MATNKENGHAVNANNFMEKVNVINRHSDEYKPSNADLVLEALNPQREKVRNSIDSVSFTRNALTLAVNNRKDGYEKMEKLARQAISMLNGSQATAIEKKHGKSLLDKFLSVRVKEVPGEEELKAKADGNSGEVKPKKTVSVSQQGYINKLNHFRTLVLFLKSVTTYIPNEAEFTVAALESFANTVESLNNLRNKASDDLSKTIDERNKLLYAENTGAYALSTMIMAYVAGSQSKNSEFYKELQKYPVKFVKTS